MTLYIIRRGHYTVYRYGSLTVIQHDEGGYSLTPFFTTARFEIGSADDMERINRTVWEAQ